LVVPYIYLALECKLHKSLYQFLLTEEEFIERSDTRIQYAVQVSGMMGMPVGTLRAPVIPHV
jgi:hypothetical protein